ncbi:MAG TPA: TonB-dependent receptor [Arenimonas sp.]|uniref:TonB-dependent receptor n=1 Tax=Arenimonas sp. TaxID=1872635 RepID=UPI002D7F312E|nr:TonB-dependent receptor [Arenimonas sp.]HEU0153539.1 TonB-dependent receptor [Arenimonas sp.]
MPRHALLAAAILGTLSLPAHGADTATVLDEITVSASTSRLPWSEAALPNTITVIDRAQLEQQLALTRDLSQVLANLIPAFAPSRQKMTSFGESLRGRQPLYLVDGVPQSTPLRDGSRDAHTIDPAMIERIEVIHGANALQGLGASGGIINIITKRAPTQPGSAFHEVSLGASSALPSEDDGTGTRGSWLYGTRQGSVDLVGGLSFAREGLHYDADGRAIAVNGVQGDLMDSAASNLFAKLGWNLDEQRRLQLTVSHYELEGQGNYVSVPGNVGTGLTATSVPGDLPLDPPRNRSSQVALDYVDRDAAGGYLQAQLFWVDFAARYGSSPWVDFFRNDPGSIWQDQSQNQSEKVGAKLSWSRDELFGLPLQATAGLDLQRDTTSQILLASNLAWVPETTYTSLSPFAQLQWTVGDVRLVGGLRHERGELDVDDYVTLPIYGAQRVGGGQPETSETLANVGIVWQATDALTLYGSYAEGYTVADIGRVLRAINVPGQDVDRLVDLSPVVADNQEIGLDYDDGRWSAHLAAYRSESDLGSLLVYDPATDNYNVRRQRTEIRGVEGNLALRLSPGDRIGVAYARTEGRYDRNQDGAVDTDLEGINISPDRATLFWERRWNDVLATRLQASQARDREFERFGTRVASFEGYTTVDLQATIALPRGQLAVGLENLLGEQYVSYYSQTTPSNDDYVAGRGRVLSVAWSHRF